MLIRLLCNEKKIVNLHMLFPQCQYNRMAELTGLSVFSSH